MLADHQRLDLFLQTGDELIGERRIGKAGRFRADRAGEHAHADQKGLLLTDPAGAVEALLIGGAPA